MGVTPIRVADEAHFVRAPPCYILSPRTAGVPRASGEWCRADTSPFPSRAEATFVGGSVSKSGAFYGRAHLSGPRGHDHPKFRRNLARREAHARALRPRGRGSRGRPRAQAPPAPRARRRARRDRRRPQGQASLDRLAARVLPAARARAGALRGGAQARRRHRPLRPPGRRPLGHAHRVAGRGAAAQLANGSGNASAIPRPARLRPTILGPDETPPEEDSRSSRPRGAASRSDEEEDEDDEEDEDEDDDLGPVQRAAPDEDEEDDEDELEDEPEDELEDEPEADVEAEEEPQDWDDEDDEEESARRAARGPQRGQALLVRARHRRRQDGRRARLRRGLAHRRRPDPHPPPQPRRPVPRRAPRPRLLQAHQPGRCSTGEDCGQRSGDRRDLPVVRAQRRQDLRAPTRSSSATRPTPPWARRPRPRSAPGPARSSSA